MTGELLPSALLEPIGGGPGVSLREGRGPRAVVALHPLPCDACVRYARRLAGAADRLEEWDARILVVVPVTGSGDPPVAPGPRVQVLSDAPGDLAAGEAHVSVADEWGEVYFSTDAGAGHAFPSPDELLEWIQFIAIQCPECEGPEGEWRTLMGVSRPPRSRTGDAAARRGRGPAA